MSDFSVYLPTLAISIRLRAVIARSSPDSGVGETAPKHKNPFLPPSALEPDQQSLKKIEQTFSEIPDQSVVVIDGLAFGVLTIWLLPNLIA